MRGFCNKFLKNLLSSYENFYLPDIFKTLLIFVTNSTNSPQLMTFIRLQQQSNFATDFHCLCQLEYRLMIIAGFIIKIIIMSFLTQDCYEINIIFIYECVLASYAEHVPNSNLEKFSGIKVRNF